MSKEPTLIRISIDIEAGRLGKARDRLHGLMTSYPEDLSLRLKLAEVYHRLGYPAEAGRFWFLATERTHEMEDAIARFIKSCDADPAQVVRRLKLKGVPGPELEGIILNQEQVAEYLKQFPQEVKRPKRMSKFAKQAWRDGCSIVILLMLIGLVRIVIDIVRWLVSLF